MLDELRIWLDESLPLVPPTCATGKALNYLNHEWKKLIRYLEDGRLEIDNNGAENAIRPFVVGRNYVEFVIMCTYASCLQIREDQLAIQCGFTFTICCWPSDATTHNHKLSKKASNALGGLNRVAVISGG